MPRYNIEHNEKWACFSSIVDGFITPFMQKDKYEEWRMLEYGLNRYQPAERCNRMTMAEAVSVVSLNRSYEDSIECLLEVGLSKDEVVFLLEEFRAVEREDN